MAKVDAAIYTQGALVFKVLLCDELCSRLGARSARRVM